MIPSAYKLPLPIPPTDGAQQRRHHEGVIIITPSSTPRWAISIKKSAIPLAVDRNRLKRQLNAALYTHRDHLSPQDFHLIVYRAPKDPAAYIKFLINQLSKPAHDH
jgi:ribonuclease P protein component